MKIQSNQIGTGKLGNAVYSQVGGVCVIREYRQTISNPNTTAQVTQRSRFKLASQIAAALSPSIIIPKKGLLSARNQFVKKNIDYFYANEEGAFVSYENLQLTAGNLGLPAITIVRNDDKINIALANSTGAGVNRVVYTLYRKTTEGNLQLVSSKVVGVAGSEGNFPTTTAAPAGDIIVYAYGMRDKDAAASAKYSNYNVTTGEDIATLISTRKLSASNYTFTQTRGTTLYSIDNENMVSDDSGSVVFLTAGIGGSVTAPGMDNGRVKVTNGNQLTITATADTDFHFVGWYNNGETVPFSATNPLTLTINQQRDIVAKFSQGSGLDE